jgi:hypothetical protein
MRLIGRVDGSDFFLVLDDESVGGGQGRVDHLFGLHGHSNLSAARLGNGKGLFFNKAFLWHCGKLRNSHYIPFTLLGLQVLVNRLAIYLDQLSNVLATTFFMIIATVNAKTSQLLEHSIDFVFITF